MVPFFIALGLNSRFVLGSHVFRALFFLPYVVPFVAGVLIWNQILGDDGWFNEGLQLLGWANPPSWLFDETWIYPALRDHGAVGHRRRDRDQPRGPPRNPDRAVRGRPDRRRRSVEASSDT